MLIFLLVEDPYRAHKSLQLFSEKGSFLRVLFFVAFQGRLHTVNNERSGPIGGYVTGGYVVCTGKKPHELVQSSRDRVGNCAAIPLGTTQLFGLLEYRPIDCYDIFHAQIYINQAQDIRM